MLKYLFLFFVIVVTLFAASLFFDVFEVLFKIAVVIGAIALIFMFLFWIL